MQEVGDQKTTLKRVLVISPAGQIYGHDKVQWYKATTERLLTHYFNIGDMVVYDSTLKMLEYSSASEMRIENPTEQEIESYCDADFAIVRASNFIHNQMQWHRAVEVLERTKLPVYAIGVGGQAATRDDYRLNDHNLKFWKTVSERSDVIGVRGTFTAELLYANGIKNVEIVGCPSLFRTRNRNLKLAIPDSIEKVAFSTRREVDASYASNPRQYLSIQRDFLLRTAESYQTTVTTHGENEEKAFFFKNEDGMKQAREAFFRDGWFTDETVDRMEKLYKEAMFFFLRVEDYDAFIREQHFALGYRVHGVLPAMAQGIPGLLVKYDTRSTELADTHAIPSLILNESPSDIKAMLREISFDDFNKLYPLRYDNMKLCLDANGIPNRL
ncbi:polysaccharide pyruvyl transferase family protein [Verticiella sediminum]|uniref:Polysaccharide pyruvyl transferase family protein n=1 Tax=Verticiella sediminum TaxID=1247510 RepID=A0A556AWG7_9BURK|nr:polysaccharide pyruvyl transferase family protein [Verticiella sediminum]TSH97289.1 polysaccharide pyruvyl transferase family protein [Verticiella sediminum]